MTRLTRLQRLEAESIDIRAVRPADSHGALPASRGSSSSGPTMTSPELENLVRIGKLKREPASDEEVVGLLQSAEDRLNDAGCTDLSYSSRFDLAYNAARALALAALRRAG